MTTKFTDVYDVFLNKINDYDYATKLEEKDLKFVLDTFLKQAVAKINLRLGEDVEDFVYDAAESKFLNDIGDIGIDLVSQFMITEYFKPNLYTTELLRQALNDRDYKMFSQANQINQMKDLYNNTRSENNALLTSYSYLRMVGEEK